MHAFGSRLNVTLPNFQNLTGTARYASINTHLGIEQSRRDDMESLGFVLIYFCNGGQLPWQGLKARTKKEKYDKISEKKLSTPIEVLCRGLPTEFSNYLNYCRALRFEDKPDYSYLRRSFRELFHRKKFQLDFVFDWTSLGPKQAGSSSSSSSKKLVKDERATTGVSGVPATAGGTLPPSTAKPEKESREERARRKEKEAAAATTKPRSRSKERPSGSRAKERSSSKGRKRAEDGRKGHGPWEKLMGQLTIKDE